MSLTDAIEAVGKCVDVVGVVVIIAGGVWSALVFAQSIRRRKDIDAYRAFRGSLGRSILLGLEILVAADIIRTVAATPTFESVGVLAGIVLIRTFLSFSLEVELEGRFPWQRYASSETAKAVASPSAVVEDVPRSTDARPSRRAG
jgi:uncharacterized membrane protein